MAIKQSDINKTLKKEESNTEIIRLKKEISTLKLLLQNINDTLEGRILSNNIFSNTIEGTHIKADAVTAEKISFNLDAIEDGDNYAKILASSLQDAKILLSRAVGNLDDIEDGNIYGKVAVTNISAGNILLARTIGNLDDIANGTNYGKVAMTSISSGKILLAETVGTLDDIEDGLNYGKVAMTSISAGRIIVAGLDSGITDRMFADSNTKTAVEAWRHINDTTMIDGGKIYANSLTLVSAANDFNWGNLGNDGNKPEDNATHGAHWGIDIEDQPDNLFQTFYQTTAPTSGMDVGDYWIDTDDNRLHRYNGSSWVEIQDSEIQEALIDAANAQATADNKIKTYFQTTAPTGDLTIGDIWFDTDDNNKPYRYDGTSWVPAPQDSADWDKIFGAGKPEDNADVTANHTAADIVNLPATPSGAGLYASGTYLGYYDSSAWKVYIQNNGNFYFGGNSNNYIQWNGLNLNIKGNIVITGGSGIASLSDAGALATLDTVGASNLDTTVISGGKIITSLLTADNIRTGTLDTVRLNVGSGDTNDIYFKYSGIKMYDEFYSPTNYRRIGFKVGSLTFARLYNQTSPGAPSVSALRLSVGNYEGAFQVQSDGEVWIDNYNGITHRWFGFYTTGQFEIPYVTNAPTSNNYYGQLIFDNDGAQGKLHVYTTAWRYIDSNLGW